MELITKRTHMHQVYSGGGSSSGSSSGSSNGDDNDE